MQSNQLEQRETMSADERDALDDKSFAYIDKDGDRHLPVHDASHVKAALGRFGQTAFDSEEDKPAAAKKIVAAAKKHGVGVSADSDVGKAAGLTEDVDGAETKSRHDIPETREARAEAALSFGDIQSRVYEALMATLQSLANPYPDCWIVDMGPDWLVYQSWGPDPVDGLYRQGYSMDDDGLVTFDGEPVRVDQVTSFVPVEQKSADRPGTELRDSTTDGMVDCPTCDGKGSILEGNRDCPDCGATGKVSADKAAELKSATPRAERPHRRLRRQTRQLVAGREFRHVASTFEVRAADDGSELVLVGYPIRYNAAYDVRDMFGTFRETMKPGAARDVLEAGADVRFLFNHDGMPLARTTSGTLLLTEDDLGVRAEAHLDNRQAAARDLAIAVERGDVSQMSCGFVVADEEWRDGEDGVEERDIFGFEELFDVSGVTYPASPTTSLELAERSLRSVPTESKERIRRMWAIAKEIREGKVLSQANGEDLMKALEALHEADDVDIPAITRSLETIDKATDVAQAAISDVLGRANPDGDADDKNPTLVDADDPAGDKDATRSRIDRQRQLLKLRKVIAEVSPA